MDFGALSGKTDHKRTNMPSSCKYLAALARQADPNLVK
jgi:hypothetical protein